MCWTLIVDYNSNVNYWVALKFRIRHWGGTLIRGGGGGVGRRAYFRGGKKIYLMTNITLTLP